MLSRSKNSPCRLLFLARWATFSTICVSGLLRVLTYDSPKVESKVIWATVLLFFCWHSILSVYAGYDTARSTGHRSCTPVLPAFFAHYSNLHSHKTHCTRINSQVSASHLCNFIFTAHYTGSVPDPVFLSGILSDQACFCDLSGICLSEIGQTVILQSENSERRSEAIAHIRILR